MGIFGKPGWLVGLLAAAFLIPYAMFDKRISALVSQALGRGQQQPSAATGVDLDSLAAGAQDEREATLPAIGALAEGQAPLCDMASALSFDVTPQWVTALWPRVTTVVGDTTSAGMRVPLVTGVMPDDLVGTLTYYFDEQQRVQRVTFSGNTGDPRRLVALVTSQYNLRPQPTLDAGLYQTKWNGKAISTLHVCHASVVAAAAAHGKFDVQLELKRANGLAGTASRPRMPGW
ncbi:MAG TPA: DUF6690 family protein [Pirellulaceae bacterium]|nr:DUF6690 family protein [Pirellulaceae bacterium]